MNEVRTWHKLIAGDARHLSFIPNESVHLVVTSPPYWNLKKYPDTPQQIGNIPDYEAFLTELEKCGLTAPVSSFQGDAYVASSEISVSHGAKAAGISLCHSRRISRSAHGGSASIILPLASG